MELDPVRIVVTGHDERGRSGVSSDLMIPAADKPSAGTYVHFLWGTDTLPEYPNNGSRPELNSAFPPPGGIRFVETVIMPDEAMTDDGSEYTDGGIDGIQFPDGLAPGMHATASVDCCVVIDGEVCVELSDGTVVVLQRGDSLVQNGTAHKWFNRTSHPARLAVFVVGAVHNALPH
ncbi:cupin domain-containing protein [Rhodococcus globerulus]|uniref:Cupin domain-containing protein n=1 Tax=Rhodococcus globerulus TaxID=33008 RepID=A0ABU4C3Q6_RHOGO|nr:cupin domain-containing protein [Rhodococcus globerulus]MDV6270848.1 cupin domain-containing protein [Rhodococcus globerulus]